MRYRAVCFDTRNEKNVRRFLRFPSSLYSKEQLTQDIAAERALLKGEHILSHYFTVYPFLVSDENGNTAARCMLTVYHGQTCAYIGFFECINDRYAAHCLFRAAEEKARRLGCDRLIGPVDASFWIRYRLKTNCFDQLPYTGEPYNLSYYEGFFRENGFSVSGEYVSNRYGRIPQSALDGRNVRRLQYFAEKGYTISSLERESFEKTLREIYRMMISLYSGFQTFSNITEEEFCKLYSPLKNAADPDMVKIAYLNGKAVGFFVTLPNYGNAACGMLTPSKLWRICKVKRECKDYILLYLGTEPEHLGLGKALSECLLGEMCSRQAVSMGALIRKGKVTGSYFSRLIEKEYTYALYEKAL